MKTQTDSLTSEQQTAAETLFPRARALASTFGADDEYQSVAALALCRCVRSWRPESGAPLDAWCLRGVRNALLNMCIRCRFERSQGLSGGCWVPLDTIQTRPDASSLHELVASLPATLRAVAQASWVEGKGTRAIAAELGLTRIRVRKKLAAAVSAAERRLCGEENLFRPLCAS